ncbi:dihydroxyacetone phosphate acyltransferase-like isoform X1 [Bufo gargarizans]|uniref:dihydroxyacetone phosphate acyltransferase-like isoform X1 n=1 Tax=Bufo gargarizans TaxID=30331 RepID=UPI001CF23AB3|nr:dihydroxyacetone phosphate acyltransferase-like isoform X1 [Bufo gargarizans]
MAGPVTGKFFLQKEMSGNTKDVFEDILEERRVSSDLRCAMKSFTPVIYQNLTPCHPSALKTIVMESDDLQQAIKKISVESGEPFSVIQKQASRILDEMGHNLKLGAIRLFALSLSKIFKRLYSKVFVNLEGVQRLGKAIQEHPVVLMPSHRSYVDFLLISYIMFIYDLAIPVIAAGEDLNRMKFVGPFLRMSGAFYIRRTFHGDKLYWAVFSEYVTTMLRNGYAPIEFFIEGQRSRTGKTIHPKLGLLNVVAEPFFRGEVYDVYLVPISISYEKILEETFHVQELLGAQKSKESTSGLIKARELLKDNFGNIHIYIGHPVSLRSMASGIINRSQYNLTPRHSFQRPPEGVLKFISDLAYKLELQQIANMVLSPGDLIATILLQSLVLNYNLLVEKIYWLRNLTEEFGGCLDWPDNKSIDEVVQSSVSLHSNIMAIVDSHIILLEHNVKEDMTEELVTKQAFTFLIGASYRNKMINIFIRPALVVLACRTSHSFQKDDIHRSFCFMRNLYSKECILLDGYEEQDFEEGCLLLAKFNAISRTPYEMFITENNSVAQFLYGMLFSILEGYQLACTYVKQNIAERFTEKQYIVGARSYVLEQILKGATKCYDALSSDLLRNTLASFVQLGIVKANKLSSGTFFSPDAKSVIQAIATLEASSRKFPASRL